MAQALGGFYVGPADYSRGFDNLTQAAEINQNQKRMQEQADYQANAKQAVIQAVRSGDPNAIRDVSIKYPEFADTAKQAFGFTNEATEKVARETYRRVLSDPSNAFQLMSVGADEVERLGGRPNMMRSDARMFRENPEGALRNVKMGFAAIASKQEYEAAFQGGPGSGFPAKVQEYYAMINESGLELGSPGAQNAALVALGVMPRAGESASERLARDPELARRVVELEQQTAAAKESGKLESQLAQLPDIRASIQTAEASAKSRGESLSDFNRAKAALPGLKEVVNQLIGLADVATYTLAGRAFDVVTKEFGFGATDGSTARAKMESLVNNQVLPLLRETFGAAFTREEGVELRKTMLDINASPAQKKEILNVFYDQKMRSLETTSREIDGGGQAPAAPAAPATPLIRIDADGNIIQ
jgi:hypothetical protein